MKKVFIILFGMMLLITSCCKNSNEPIIDVPGYFDNNTFELLKSKGYTVDTTIFDFHVQYRLFDGTLSNMYFQSNTLQIKFNHIPVWIMGTDFVTWNNYNITWEQLNELVNFDDLNIPILPKQLEDYLTPLQSFFIYNDGWLFGKNTYQIFRNTKHDTIVRLKME